VKFGRKSSSEDGELELSKIGLDYQPGAEEIVIPMGIQGLQHVQRMSPGMVTLGEKKLR
jgi:hypothetical protein